MNIGDMPVITAVPEIDERNRQWLAAFRADPDKLISFYTAQALLFFGKEPYIPGSASILRFYEDLSGQLTITDYQVVYRVCLKENPDMVYEIGSFLTGSGDSYLFLTLWSRQQERWLRVIDVLSPKAVSVPEDPDIDTARALWIRYSNSHNALSLAEHLYQKDFVYYNRGLLYESYAALADIYSYMNEDDFQVTLSKDVLLMAQTDLAFEIGTWTTNSTGSYIIVWEKRDNRWGIRLDANW